MSEATVRILPSHYSVKSRVASREEVQVPTCLPSLWYRAPWECVLEQATVFYGQNWLNSTQDPPN